MHSEGILAGELKHGPLALIDKQMPVIMVIMKDPCFTKCQNALQQVTARQVSCKVVQCCRERNCVHWIVAEYVSEAGCGDGIFFYLKSCK